MTATRGEDDDRPADAAEDEDEDVAASDPDSPGAALAVDAEEIPEPNEPG